MQTNIVIVGYCGILFRPHARPGHWLKRLIQPAAKREDFESCWDPNNSLQTVVEIC